MRRLLPVLVPMSLLVSLFLAVPAGASPQSHAGTATSTTVTQIPSSPFAPCINNDCPVPGATVTYQGGPLLAAPVIYLVRFSDSQTSLSPTGGFVDGTFAPDAPNAAGAAMTTVNSSAGWWRAEYSAPGYTLGTATYGGVITLFSPNLADQILVPDSAIQAALTNARASGALPSTPDAIYATFLRLGQISYFGSLGINSETSYCAYHSFDPKQSFTYTVMPANATSPGCAATVAGTTPLTPFDSLTAALSHEITETITDPYQSGWYQATQTPATAYSAGEEVSDLCVGEPISGTTVNDSEVSYQGGNYVLQFQYSNSAQGCLLTPLEPSLLVTQASATSFSAQLYTGDEGIAGATVSLSTPEGSVTATTNATGVATFTTASVTAGATVTATSQGSGGVAAETASITTTAATPVTLSLVQNPLSDPTAPISLDATVSPAGAGTLYAFGPFGQLLGTGTTTTAGTGSVTLVTSDSGDLDTVTFVGVGSAASTLMIAPTSTITVTAPAKTSIENPLGITVKVTPAEAGVSIYTSVDGIANLSSGASGATDASGTADVQVLTLTPGPAEVAVYAITPHGIISTDVSIDFQAQVFVSGGTISSDGIHLTVSDGAFVGYVNSPLSVKLGSQSPVLLTTDATASVSLPAKLSSLSAGELITVTWPESTKYSGGNATFFVPGANDLTPREFAQGQAIFGGTFSFAGAECTDHHGLVSCRYTNQVSAAEHVVGLNKVRFYANKLVILGPHARTITLGRGDNVILNLSDGISGPIGRIQLGVVTAAGHVLWASPNK